MAIERERKFLIEEKDLPTDYKQWQKHEIQQGYLMTNDNQQLRVRISKNILSWGSSKSAAICFKQDIDEENRYEFEKKLLIGEANSLLALCETKLNKTRYSIQVKNSTDEEPKYQTTSVSIDVYQNGLYIAEVEYVRGYDGKLKIPTWCTKDVTGNRDYSNIALAEKFSKKE